MYLATFCLSSLLVCGQKFAVLFLKCFKPIIDYELFWTKFRMGFHILDRLFYLLSESSPFESLKENEKQMASQWYYHSLFWNINVKLLPWSSCLFFWSSFRDEAITGFFCNCTALLGNIINLQGDEVCMCISWTEKMMGILPCEEQVEADQVEESWRSSKWGKVCLTGHQLLFQPLLSPLCPACTSHPTKANTAQICCSVAFYMAPRG